MDRSTHKKTQGSKTTPLSLNERSIFLTNHPCFAQLSPEEIKQLASLLTEQSITKGQDIVIENDLVDSIYFIVKGKAEVRLGDLPVATLGPGESIGLSETGFYSETGKRTATVTALTRMMLLQLDVETLDKLASGNSQLDQAMRQQAGLLQRMNLIKRAAPFANLSADDLRAMAEKTQELTLPKDHVIFKQGEPGDYCYLIKSGKVDVYTTSVDNGDVKLATLNHNMVFGETALILNTERTASVKTITECKLLALSRDVLTEATKKNVDIGKSLMILTKSRVRPVRYSHIEQYSYQAQDGQLVVTLKDTINYNYYRLTEEGLYLWNQINGKRSIHDLARIYYNKYDDYDPGMISGVITDLMEEKFVVAEPPIFEDLQDKTALGRVSAWLIKIFEATYSFGYIDEWVTKQYQRWVKWLFTPIALILLAAISITGLVTFVFCFHHIAGLLKSVAHPGWVLVAILPISMASMFLHELSHAFTTKHFGRYVRNFGVGWYWLGPIAFCDTSDMWLSPKSQRVWVDLAGMFIDSVIAGVIMGCYLLATDHSYELVFLIYALFTYIGIIHNLTPFIELDGYYALSGLSGRENLRLDAVLWAMKNYKKIVKKPTILFQTDLAVIFWWIAIVFLIIEISLTYVISKYLLYGIFGIQYPWISFIIVIIVIFLSSLTLVIEARKELEKEEAS